MMAVPEKSIPEGYRVAPASRADREGTLKFLSLNMTAEKEYFASKFKNYPNSLDEHSRICFSPQGEIVSHIRVYPTLLNMGGGCVAGCGLIGDVCTHPDHRKKGLGSALLRDAISYMITLRSRFRSRRDLRNKFVL